MFLETHLHPLSTTKNPRAWLPQQQPKLPKTLLPLQQAGPRPALDRDLKAMALLPSHCSDHQCIATILQAIPRTSTSTQQCHKEVLHQKELQAPLHPLTAAVNSTKGPPEGSVPPEHPGRCWQPAQGTQLSFKDLQVLHLRCEPLKSFFLRFLSFFFLLDENVAN